MGPPAATFVTTTDAAAAAPVCELARAPSGLVVVAAVVAADEMAAGLSTVAFEGDPGDTGEEGDPTHVALNVVVIAAAAVDPPKPTDLGEVEEAAEGDDGDNGLTAAGRISVATGESGALARPAHTSAAAGDVLVGDSSPACTCG